MVIPHFRNQTAHTIDFLLKKEVYLPNTGLRRKYFPMPPISIDEARHQLDLIDHEFHLFREEESWKLQVIYRRNHGDYGVIKTYDLACHCPCQGYLNNKTYMIWQC